MAGAERRFRRPPVALPGEQASWGSQLALVGLLALALLGAGRWLWHHPERAWRILAALALLALVVGVVVTLRLERRDPETEPAGAGIPFGAVPHCHAWSGLVSEPRLWRLPWGALETHALVEGPTGVGKTESFIKPLLVWLAHRPDPVGKLYLDGKGTELPLREELGFDWVFEPAHPERSARWNPIAGADPYTAAERFASALYADAEARGDSAFYHEAAKSVLMAAIPVLVREAASKRLRPRNDRQLVEVMVEVTGGEPGRCEEALRQLKKAGYGDEVWRQLEWFGARMEKQRAGAVKDRLGFFYLCAKNREGPPGGDVENRATLLVTDAESGRLEMPTPLDTYDALFVGNRFARLAAVARRAGMRQQEVQLRSMAELRHHDRLRQLQNVHNRLGLLLSPPFDRLCSASDFGIEGVREGGSYAFVLPTEQFPVAARPIGRMALAQFQQAVLTPGAGHIQKQLVADEFSEFVGEGFGQFLDQAREQRGAAFVSFQSLAQMHPSFRGQMLANYGSIFLMHGLAPESCEYWAKALGRRVRPDVQVSQDHSDEGFIRTRTHREQVRVGEREDFVFSPTEINQLRPGQVIARARVGRTFYRPLVIEVSDPAKRSVEALAGRRRTLRRRPRQPLRPEDYERLGVPRWWRGERRASAYRTLHRRRLARRDCREVAAETSA